MREQTRKMLTLLKETGTTDDHVARRRGIKNARREVAIIDRFTAYSVDIQSQTDKKREYTLI